MKALMFSPSASAYNPEFALDRGHNGNPEGKKGKSSLDWVITEGDVEHSYSTYSFFAVSLHISVNMMALPIVLSSMSITRRFRLF
jgi:hypothetical protein